jgi:hypothetical protein
MADENEQNWLRTLLKTILIIVVVLIAIVVLGFGLLVGFCAFGGR